MVKDSQSIIYVGAKKDITAGPDTFVLETESLAIGVEEIRRLKKAMALGQSVVIPAAQKLTEEAQNALLKTLEEPPENTSLVLITTDLDTLLPTVVSRCHVIELPKEPLAPLGSETKKIFQAIDKNDSLLGFSWAAKTTDRQKALEEIERLIICAHQEMAPRVARKLLRAKKYLRANTNVRLTLENLFLD